MEQNYGLRICFLILLINHNTDALPHHADGTIKETDQFLRISEKSGDIPGSEEQVRDRRSIVDTLFGNPPRRFTDIRDMPSDAIIFPDDIEHMQQVSVSPVCKGSSTYTYCDTVTNYPEQTVNEALKRNESLKYLAVVDEVSEPDRVQRLDANDVVPLCVSTEEVIYVQAAMNKDSQWRYIANQENFRQGIRIEKCRNENVKCNTVIAPGVGYRTSCRQKYAYRQLVAVLPNEMLVLDTFRFPSSCCCHLEFIGVVIPRIRI